MASENPAQKTVDQWLDIKFDFNDSLDIWIEAFFKSRKAARMAMLAECQRDGIPLLFVAVADDGSSHPAVGRYDVRNVNF